MSPKRIAVLVVAIVLATTVTALAGERRRPASTHAKYFGLLVGPQPGRLVTGFLDESGGDGRGFDTAVLDLDGDGAPETPQKLEIQKIDADWIIYTMSFVIDEVHYQVEFSDLGRAALEVVWIGWTGSHPDGGAAVFINGAALLSTNPMLTAFLPRLRLCRPFRFDVIARTRGPEIIANVALHDAMGGTLRLAFTGQKEENIVLVLERGDAKILEASGEYG